MTSWLLRIVYPCFLDIYDLDTQVIYELIMPFYKQKLCVSKVEPKGVSFKPLYYTLKTCFRITDFLDLPKVISKTASFKLNKKYLSK